MRTGSTRRLLGSATTRRWNRESTSAELPFGFIRVANCSFVSHSLLKNVTGASKVIIFDHTIRRGEKQGEETADTPENRKPVAMGELRACTPSFLTSSLTSPSSKVHVDQTVESGRRRVERHASSPEEAARLLRGTAQLINVWRPLRGPVLDVPLAFADARTLNKEELVKSRLIYRPPQPEGETLRVKHSPEHRWYYLSEMQPDEGEFARCLSPSSRCLSPSSRCPPPSSR